MSKIEELIEAELKRAREKFPKLLNSPHEGFAVLSEEIDELNDQMKDIKKLRKALWSQVKRDDLENQAKILERSKSELIKLIKEAIQVGAMIDKYQQDVFNQTHK